MNAINIKYPKYLDELSRIFADNGHTLYIVGGYVRDALLGYLSDDIDICSDALPEKVAHMLDGSDIFNIAETRLPMGTVIIKCEGDALEYTAFRRESYRGDGTHAPEQVSFSATIEQDAQRRDFTCNALYYDIAQSRILDFFGGADDIANRMLITTRAPHDVFSEDALRILRMARIAAEVGFIPGSDETAAAKLLAQSLNKLSKERIVSEIARLLRSDTKYAGSDKSNIEGGMQVLFESGAADVLFPGTRLEKSLVCAKARSYSVRAALFLYKCTSLSASLDYICPDSDMKRKVRFLLKYAAYEDDDSLALLAKYGYARGKLLEEMMAVLKKHHHNLSRFLENMGKGQKVLSMETLALGGRDIKEALGLPDSPEIGKIKHMLLLHVIEHPLDNKKECLLDHLIKTYPAKKA
jgi:tRNA nucleotidyltransferase/poly(A) polymerase